MESRSIDAVSRQQAGWLVVARIAHPPGELERRCDLAFEDGHDELGLTQESMLESGGGQRYWLVAHPQAGPDTEVRIRQETKDRAAALDEGLVLLGLSLEDLAWIDPDIEFKPWTVWRQDDHGNRFLVTVAGCQADAAKIAAAYEARGHKQIYWISSAEDRGRKGER